MDFSHINFYALSTLINFFVSFFFGVFVYTQDRKNNVNKSFSLFILSVALYSLCLFFVIQSISFETALTFARLSVSSAAFVSVLSFYFVVVFLDIWEKYKIWIKGGVVIFSLFSLAAALPVDWLVRTVEPISVFKYFPLPGILFTPFLIVWVGYFVASFIFLVLYHKRVDRIKKAQIRYLLLGLALGNIGGSGNWILMSGIPIVPPYIVLSFLVFAYGYAVLKHHLFSIRMFAVEILTFAIWFVLLVKILATGQAGDTIFFDVIIFLSVVVIGSFLIRTGMRESRQKELLDDLNQNLQKKVDEQTVEIRKAYEVEKEARKELEKLNEVKNEFVLASQHNLRTPITIVKGYVQEAELRTKESDTKTYLDKMSGVLDTLSDLVNGLIDVTQLKVGKIGFSKDKKPLSSK